MHPYQPVIGSLGCGRKFSKGRGFHSAEGSSPEKGAAGTQEPPAMEGGDLDQCSLGFLP